MPFSRVRTERYPLIARSIQLVTLALALSACALGQTDTSKPEVSQPPTAQQGSATDSQQASPNPSAQEPASPAVQEPSTQTAQPSVEPKTAESSTPKAPSPTAKKSSAHTKTAAGKKNGTKQGQKADANNKVVIHNGGAKYSSPQLSPAMPSEQATHSRENTAQLLATTDANLKAAAGRQLSPAQQSVVDQIHSYVRQSKAASASGDLARAHTLAYKAHLLSDDLAHK